MEVGNIMGGIVKELNKYPKDFWDFKGKTKTGIHSIGKYPATMVPDMQYELLNLVRERIKKKNINLLDPFCGSGTTLVIAQELGMQATGIDINPYATLLSATKTNVYNRNSVLSAIRRLEKSLEDKLNVPNHYFNNIEKWFRSDIIQSLSQIRYCIMQEKSKKIRNFFWICFSETISKFSNDRTSTFKLHTLPEDKICLITDNCIEFFLKKIYENSLWLNYDKKSKVHIIYGNCIEIMQQNLNKKFEIICTSPPYGDNSTTVTYGQASILSLKWIDENDLSCPSNILEKYSTIDRISIGGEKRKINYTSFISSLSQYLEKISPHKRSKVINFFEDYYDVIDNLKDHLTKDGYLIMTVGNRSIDGIKQPLDDITIEIAKNFGLKVVSKFYRNILHKKTASTVSDENEVKSISEETVLIFTKQVE